MKKLFRLIILTGIILIGVSGLFTIANKLEREQEVLMLVNKQTPLETGYVPRDLVQPNIRFYYNMSEEEKLMKKEAAEALEELFTDAEKNKIILCGLSGYRSYTTQKEIYEKRVKVQGKENADKYVAKPGESEHSTGLAMDVTNEKYSTNIGNTEEGLWLRNNAYKFGFIIRYPKDKEDITGYSYEPWHIRYVGKKAAKKMDLDELVLEEYIDANE